MNKLQILIFPHLPYNSRDHIRLGGDYFENHGHKILILDATPFLLPGYREKLGMELFNHPGYILFDQEVDFQSFISKVNNYSVIVFYSNDNKTLSVLSKIKNKKIKTMFYGGGVHPILVAGCGLLSSFKKLVEPFVVGLSQKYQTVKMPVDFFVIGSSMEMKVNRNLIGKKTQTINGNSLDFDAALNATPFRYEKPYCVFLDSAVMDSPDFLIFNVKVSDRKEAYAKKLNRLFEYISEKYSVEVIIAPHPKTNFYNENKYFSGYKKISGDSAGLVGNAQFVVSHGSTSVSFPVFYGKPLLLITMEESNHVYRINCSVAKSLRKQLVNIDRINKKTKDMIHRELKNKNGYNRYKRNYLSSEGRESVTLQSICEKLDGYAGNLKGDD